MLCQIIFEIMKPGPILTVFLSKSNYFGDMSGEWKATQKYFAEWNDWIRSIKDSQVVIR